MNKNKLAPVLAAALLTFAAPSLAADPPAAPPAGTGAAKGEGKKADDAKSDGAKSEGAKSDGAKSEGAKSDGAKSDGAKSEGAKSDGAKSDGGKSDGAGAGEAGGAGAGAGGGKPEGGGAADGDGAEKGGDATAAAAEKGAAVSGARALFEAGARAYTVGNYRAAIQAFEQAYGVEQRPGLLFSIAQAHRRQFRVDGRPGHVAVAIRRYEEYLAAQHRGGRRSDAEAALAELRPIARKLEQDGQLQPLSPQEVERATRLIVTSSAPGATVLLDGDAAPKPAPLIVELSPGRHRIRVAAENHFGEERVIEVANGAVTALDLPLRERPASLAVAALEGARVSLDGRLAGDAPLAGPLEVPGGRHTVLVQKAGHVPYSTTIELGPGARTTVEAPLPLTFQRKVSIGLLIGGGAAVAGGVVLGGLALAQQAEAAGIKGDMDQGKVVCRGQECPELDRYNGALSARDALRAGAFTLAGIGAVSAGAGLFFYLVDGAWPFVRAPGDAAPGPSAPSARGGPIRVSAAPLVGPGLGGVSLSGQF